MASAFCEQWGVKSDWNLKRIHPLPSPLWAIITHLVRLSRVSKTLLGQLGLDKLDKLCHELLI